MRPSLQCALLALATLVVPPSAPCRERSTPPACELAADARVSDEGAMIAAGAHEIAIGLAAIGREGHMRPASTSSPTRHGGEVRIARAPGVIEWWRAVGAGLEQGVTLSRRPSGEGALVLEMNVGSGVRASEGSSAGVIALEDAASGALLATYSHLAVRDARGRAVASRMRAADRRIRIEVDDDGARYPLVVDPLVVVQEAALTGTTPSFGTSVAMNGAGTIAVVGEPDAEFRNAFGTSICTSCGAVFTYSGPGTWSETASARAGGGNHGDAAGASVGYGQYGRIYGAPHALARGFSDEGLAFYVSAVGFSTPPDGAQLGTSVAASAAMGIAGAPAAASGAGRALLIPSDAGAVLMASDGAPGDRLGTSVDVDDPGTYAIVGAPGDSPAGSARIFAISGSGAIATEGPTLLPPSPVAGEGFGRVVALSGDGLRAFVGSAQNRVVVFLRTGTTWAVEATLTGAAGSFGESIAVSADGARVAIGAPGDGPRGIVRIFFRAGSTWVEASQVPGPSGASAFGRSVAIDDAGDRMIVGGTGGAWIFALSLAPNGTACASAAGCASNLCVDGVCCATACGDGAADCQACSPLAGGMSAGTCTPLDATAAAARTCRASAGVCDRAETCSPTQTTCPADVMERGVVCRPSAGTCDAAETCNGVDPGCPPLDARMPGGTVCRAAAGLCDREEMCDGTSIDCAADSYFPAGTTCGGMGMGSCATTGSCNGTSPMCPGATPLPHGHVCLAHDASNPCDVDDVCDGVHEVCPPRYAEATVGCGTTPSGPCDAPDHCMGTSADCVPTFAVGAICRPPSGSCDVAEICSGSGPDCPPDSVLGAGVVCNPSSEACDPAEVCDGLVAMCPTNVTCPVDAGSPVDAGAPSRDAGPTSAPDAGTTPPPGAGGCGCRTGGLGGGPRTGALAFALLLAARLVARRRGT